MKQLKFLLLSLVAMVSTGAWAQSYTYTKLNGGGAEGTWPLADLEAAVAADGSATIALGIISSTSSSYGSADGPNYYLSIDNNKVKTLENKNVFTIEPAATSGKYTLKTQDGQYVQAGSNGGNATLGTAANAGQFSLSAVSPSDYWANYETADKVRFDLGSSTFLNCQDKGSNTGYRSGTGGFSAFVIWKIQKEAESSKTYTCHVTGADGKVVYDGTEYGDGDSFSAILDQSLLSSKEIEGYAGVVTVDGTNITVTYTPALGPLPEGEYKLVSFSSTYTTAPAEGFYVINGLNQQNESNHYLYDDNGTVKGSGTIALNSIEGASRVWYVRGNATDGWTFQNVATRKFMHLGASNGSAVSTSDAEATLGWYFSGNYATILNETAGQAIDMGRDGGSPTTWAGNQTPSGSRRLRIYAAEVSFADPLAAAALEKIAEGEAVYAKTLAPVVKGDNTKLLTDASQLYCNAPDSEEGLNIGNLIDGNPATYFHSSWHTGYDAYAPHYLRVNLPENDATMLYLEYADRQGAVNDHIKTMNVYGSNDGGDTYSALLATVELPTHADGATGAVGFNLGDTPYSCYKFDVVDCGPTYRTYFHSAEFQLYKGAAGTPEYNVDNSYKTALRNAIDALQTKVNNETPLTQADIDAVTTAMSDIINNVNEDYTVTIVGDPTAAATVQIAGVDGVFGNGQVVNCHPIAVADITASDVTDYAKNVTLDGNNINVTYKVANNAALLNNNAAFTFTSDRGFMFSKTGDEKLYANYGITFDGVAADKQFAVVKSDNNNLYLYSIAENKFAYVDGGTVKLSSTPSAVGKLLFDDSSNATYNKLFYVDGKMVNVSSSAANKIYIGWEVEDPGNQWQITYTGAVDLTDAIATVNNFENHADVTALKAALAQAEAMEALLGDGVGHYTDGSGLLALAIAGAQSYGDDTPKSEQDDVDAATSALTTALASCTLNMPAANTFLRVKANPEKIASAYLTSTNVVPAGKDVARAQFSATAENGTILFYDGTNLVNYTTGLKLISNAEGAGFAAWADGVAEGTAVEFSAASQGNALYNVTYNGTRHLYSNANMYTDAGNTLNADLGYTFVLEEVSELPLTLSQVGDNYYSTLYLPMNATVAGAEIYTANTGEKANALYMNQVLAVPANEGVVIASTEPTATVVLGGEASGMSELTGALALTEVPSDAVRVFSKTTGKEKVGFYKLPNTITTLKAFKAYYEVGVNAASVFELDWSGTTGIASVLGKKNVEGAYDLQGRKVNNVQKGSIYILNGKKVIK